MAADSDKAVGASLCRLLRHQSCRTGIAHLLLVMGGAADLRGVSVGLGEGGSSEGCSGVIATRHSGVGWLGGGRPFYSFDILPYHLL